MKQTAATKAKAMQQYDALKAEMKGKMSTQKELKSARRTKWSSPPGEAEYDRLHALREEMRTKRRQRR